MDQFIFILKKVSVLFILPVLLGAIGGWVSFFFTKRKDNRTFLLKEAYNEHLNMLDKLDDFFEKDVAIANDFDGFFKHNKVLKQKTKEFLKLSYLDYMESQKNDVWKYATEITHIHDPQKVFETWVDNLKAISRLSTSSTRKIASKIYQNFITNKRDETLFMDSIFESIGLVQDSSEKIIVKNYVSFIQNHYWKLFLIENIKDLRKLQKQLKKFVALR